MRVLGEEVEFHTIPWNLSPSFFIYMNNDKENESIKLCLISKPRVKARAVTMDLFGAMRKNDVELHEVMSVLEEAVKGFLMPLGRTLGFEKGEILKVFGNGIINLEPK